MICKNELGDVRKLVRIMFAEGKPMQLEWDKLSMGSFTSQLISEDDTAMQTTSWSTGHSPAGQPQAATDHADATTIQVHLVTHVGCQKLDSKFLKSNLGCLQLLAIHSRRARRHDWWAWYVAV